jgi:hypothetical protein
MNREVVQDFLNLPGIVGVALMDGRSRPYFCGVDQTLNFQQKEALAQGIQQVIATTPSDFHFFEFQFSGHQVYIYKLDYGMILLVLATSHLVSVTYCQTIDQLKIELRKDIGSAIATFRLLAGKITLSNQSYWKQQSDPRGLPSPKPADSLLSNGVLPKASIQRPTDPDSLSLRPAPFLSVLEVATQSTPLAPTTDTQPSLNDLLLALNHLSQFTTQYLGVMVIANYWKATRPANEWLDNFQIDRSAHITFCGAMSLNIQLVSPEQHQSVYQWVDAFIHRSSKVIRDFPLLIKQNALDDRQKMLLLPDNF